MSAAPIVVDYPAVTAAVIVLGPWEVLPDTPTPITTEAGEIIRTEVGFRLERTVAP